MAVLGHKVVMDHFLKEFSMAGYHKRDIPRGILGLPSKITEEYLEFIDSVEQDNHVMALHELSDLIGAIKSYAAHYNITLNDLIRMQETTENVFMSGHRIPK
jgi:hypothetical protein